MDRMTTHDLARVLALLRVAKGWTKKELAAASGTPAYRLTAIEKAKITPRLPALHNLLTTMGYPMNALEKTWVLLRDLRATMQPERRTTRTLDELPGEPRYRIVR